MKISGSRADGFAAKPDPKIRAVLVHGPDSGLVRERAMALVRRVVADPRDPFRVAELTGAALKSDPARLADEAASLAFGGGRRVVRVRDAGEESVAAFTAFLDDPKGDSLVVAEAGALGTRAALVKLFDASDLAAGIACYEDSDQDLESLVDRTLGAEKIRLAGDAREFLLDRIGSDRQVTRGELAKLALYAGPGGTLTVADIASCLGDTAGLSLDDVALAAGDGDLPELMRCLDRAWAGKDGPVQVLRSVIRHFQRLHLAAALVAEGKPPKSALAGLRPPVIFKHQDRMAAQLRRWPPDRAAAALSRLTRAEIDCKTTGYPDVAICTRTLMEIARAAARPPGGTSMKDQRP